MAPKCTAEIASPCDDISSLTLTFAIPSSLLSCFYMTTYDVYLLRWRRPDRWRRAAFHADYGMQLHLFVG